MSRGDPGLLYLYCVLEPESAADALLSTGEVAGVEPGECLFPIRASNLVAAVSRVPSDLFSEQALNELMTDLPRLAPYAIRHEQAIRDLCDAGPALLPMTFGAVYLSEARVRMLLRHHAADFRHRLEGVRDRQEWEVKVF